MEWTTKREMNHTYVIADCDYEHLNKDFRFRMLKENKLSAVIEMDIRNINGNYRIYMDVSDREPLSRFFESHAIEREELEKVFGSLMRLSQKLKEHFCEESIIVTNPDYIFRNRITDSYEFICMPLSTEEEETGNPTELLQFFIDHISTSDMDVIESLFEVYDMSLSQRLSYDALFTKFMNYKKSEENEEMHEEKMDCEVKDDVAERSKDVKNRIESFRKKHYVPALEETIAGGCFAIGILLMGTYMYLNWI